MLWNTVSADLVRDRGLRLVEAARLIAASITATIKSGPVKSMSDSSPLHQQETTPDDRLDSWKEIAASLRRDVPTVQRWETREEMPVHRHVHDKKGSVYGFRSELDAWARSRNLAPAARDVAKDTAKPCKGTAKACAAAKRESREEVAAADTATGKYLIQVGAFKSRAEAQRHLDKVAKSYGKVVNSASPQVQSASGNYRARFKGFSAQTAKQE
jgi:hypothetical protein